MMSKEYKNNDEQYVKIADQLMERLKEKTLKKCVTFHLRPGETGVQDSKIGGVPFIPKGGTYPVHAKTGEKLHLLIQLNLSDMPHIQSFPTCGILQIFIAADDCYGMNFDDPLNQEAWRILYHEDSSNPMPIEEVRQLMPVIPEDCWELPFENPGQEFLLEFTVMEMPVTAWCFNFDQLVQEVSRDILPDELKEKEWFELPDPLVDRLNEELNGEGSRLGGHPGFTQSDPRANKRFQKYELLLQIDSEGVGNKQYLMWGDCGIANFFIDPEDLKKRNFSKVYYNWDCC